MGTSSNGEIISCAVCGMTVELQAGGAYKFDLPSWTSTCPYGGGGSPVLCPRFGKHLKLALIGEPHGSVHSGDED